MSEVRLPSTESDQSVPRMAATAAGVLTSTPEPPRAARAQMLPPCEAELGRAGRAAGDVVDGQGRVAADANLGLVVEQDREVADLVGAQRIAAQHALLDEGGAPQILAHEAHFLAALGGHDGACGRRRARHGGLRLRIGKAKREGAGRGQKPEKS